MPEKFVRRNVSAPVKSWADWDVAANMLGVGRDAFITGVCDAAYRILTEAAQTYRKTREANLRGKERRPGRGDSHLRIHNPEA